MKSKVFGWLVLFAGAIWGAYMLWMSVLVAPSIQKYADQRAANKLANEIIRGKLWNEFLEWVLLLIQMIGWFLVAAIFCAGLIIVIVGVEKIYQRRNTPVNGIFPVHRVKLGPFWRGWLRPIAVVNPNLLTTGAAVIMPNGDVHQLPVIDHALQRTQIEGFTRAQAVAAMPSGSMSARAWKVLDDSKRGKLADPVVSALPPPEPGEWEDVTPATVVDPPQQISFEQALLQAPRDHVALGVTETDPEVVYWNMGETPHLRVHGRTQGAGKTNAMRVLATGAIMAGHHVVVVDRRRFKDWGEFSEVAELVDGRDSAVLVDVARILRSTYLDRDAILGQYGAANIRGLPPSKGLRRVIVLWGEFGTMMDKARTEGRIDEMEEALRQVAAEAGATGVHLVVEDQNVDGRWPRQLVGNLAPVSGSLPLNYGSTGGYAKAHTLKPHTFFFDGLVFRPWHATEQVTRCLGRALPVRTPLFAAGTPSQPPPSVAEASAEVGGGSDAGASAVNETKEAKQAIALRFLEENLGLVWSEKPGDGSTELAKLYAREFRGDESQYEDYKSEAYRFIVKAKGQFQVTSKAR